MWEFSRRHACSFCLCGIVRLLGIWPDMPQNRPIPQRQNALRLPRSKFPHTSLGTYVGGDMARYVKMGGSRKLSQLDNKCSTI